MGRKNYANLLFAVVVVCFLAPSALAGTYVWVDQAGQTRQTKNRPKDHQVSRWISTPGSKQKKSRAKVDLYVTSWCPYCHKAAEYFRQRGVAIRIYDIEKDKKAAARKQRLSGGKQGVPFAVVNGVAISGYDPDRYGQALR
jgi:glutaredoxin